MGLVAGEVRDRARAFCLGVVSSGARKDMSLTSQVSTRDEVGGGGWRAALR